MAMTMNYFADVDAIAPADCIVHAAPMSHGSGCYGLPHVARAALQVTPESGHFDPAEIVGLVNALGGCTFFMAPTMIVRLLQSPALGALDRARLKTIVYGGGPMYVADTLAALDALGQKLVQIYGQGEAPMTITGLSRADHADTGHPRYRERLGSVGVARTDVEVRVVDGNDRDVPPGEVGEIVVRGDVVMQGYWANPAATAKTLAGGWLHTGDVGAFDADGYLTLKDRSKDMIISGGSNIYPREVEEVLLKHPGVLECSVVGRPSADWGEEVVAFVVARPGASVEPRALDALCLDHIARFKRPKEYRLVAALPKNNYGKVLKTELRAALSAERPATG
jgi:long-chain acyl-CoA synthetase